MIQEGLDHISAYLTDLATRSGQPPQQIIDRFLKQHARLNPTNDWNRYSKYFTHYTDTAVTVRKKCYELFKKEYRDTWHEILIKFEESTQYTEAGKTVAQRQQLFNKSAKRFTQSLAALSKAHGIETAFVMAGSIVNQDASLGYAYTTPGAEDFFVEHCHADTDAIIGHFKAHI
ncbi:hypothetical protein BKA83DRAFT_16431, partial [Pisolithus microcarpus]